MTELDTTRRLLRLDVVPRWTVIPTIKHQSVATHVYNTMVLARVLCLGGMFPASIEMGDLLEIMLVHEEDEAHSGCIPSTFKHGTGLEVGSMSDMDLAKRIIDTMDALMFIRREIAMGNSAVCNVNEQLTAKLKAVCNTIPLWWPHAGPKYFEELYDFIRVMDAHQHPSMEGMLDDSGNFEVQANEC